MDKPSIEWAVKTLRCPAGWGGKFTSFEDIRQNQEEFNKIVHAAFKEVHAEAIKTILVMEVMLRGRPIDDPSTAMARLYVQIWRRVNDAMVWTILGNQRHIIKRLCHFKKRPPLANEGASAVLEAIDRFNTDPNVIAMWTDATSCIDLGDIVHVDLNLGRRISLIEVKSGKVSEKLASLRIEEAGDFLAQYGKHGVKQVARIARQQQRASQTLDVLNKDEGIDSLSGLPIKLYDCSIPDESYDAEMRQLLAKARVEPEAIVLIDGCLWVYATRFAGQTHETAKRRFCDLILADQCNISQWLLEDMQGPEPQPIFSLLGGVYYPPALPIFLRALEDEDTLDIASGKLLVLMLFDWGKFSEIVSRAGAEFRWSSAKQGRRARSSGRDYRPLIIGDFVPQIHLEERSFSMGAPQFFRMVYDGLRPSCWAGQAAEVLKRQKRGFGSTASPLSPDVPEFR